MKDQLEKQASPEPTDELRQSGACGVRDFEDLDDMLKAAKNLGDLLDIIFADYESQYYQGDPPPGRKEFLEEIMNKIHFFKALFFKQKSLLSDWMKQEESLWREWQFCKDHKFELEAICINKTREMVTRKIRELDDVLKP